MAALAAPLRPPCWFDADLAPDDARRAPVPAVLLVAGIAELAVVVVAATKPVLVVDVVVVVNGSAACLLCDVEVDVGAVVVVIVVAAGCAVAVVAVNEAVVGTVGRLGT